jgi:hypothetical protein
VTWTGDQDPAAAGVLLTQFSTRRPVLPRYAREFAARSRQSGSSRAPIRQGWFPAGMVSGSVLGASHQASGSAWTLSYSAVWDRDPDRRPAKDCRRPGARRALSSSQLAAAAAKRPGQVLASSSLARCSGLSGDMGGNDGEQRIVFACDAESRWR